MTSPATTAPTNEPLHRVGLLGGMSWHSTAVYYRRLNEAVCERVGGHSSAPVTIHSVDAGELEPLQRAGEWPAVGRILAAAATALERADCEAVALATNTMHLVAGEIRAVLTVPFIDLIDLVAEAVAEHDAVGVIGTNYTMTSDLYPKRLAQHGTQVLVPVAVDRDVVHRIIFDELVHGEVRDDSRAAYRAVMARLVDRGATAIVLACTEIALLVGEADASVPVLDTTALHCRAITDFVVPGALA